MSTSNPLFGNYLKNTLKGPVNPLSSRSFIVRSAQQQKRRGNLNKKKTENARQVVHILRNGGHLNHSQLHSAQKGLTYSLTSKDNANTKLTHILKIFTLIAFYTDKIFTHIVNNQEPVFRKLLKYVSELVRGYRVPLHNGKKSYEQILTNTKMILSTFPKKTPSLGNAPMAKLINGLAKQYTILFQRVSEGHDLNFGYDSVLSQVFFHNFNKILTFYTHSFPEELSTFFKDIYLNVLSARTAESAITALANLPLPTNLYYWATRLTQNRKRLAETVNMSRRNMVRPPQLPPRRWLGAATNGGPRKRNKVEFPRGALRPEDLFQL
jgi:hypothetical protein